ncbi:hypothetical protein Agub_g4865 [Astrephomene gubernaculifera]|uniref:Importin N-terminal domain-containing protein n=1 Tax=Astrephomene gubernaculifera TaxID=47775 RepID=A0AAD3DLE5_9CHLO|nr:hypothetical protein Agub_g4865 [Astrephomene gubernaculifera]
MASTVWAPTQEGVHKLVSLLTLYQQPGTNQSQIFQQLEACRAYPDFNNYLAFIFATGEQLSVEVRQSAGLLLKNNLSKHYKDIPAEFKAYIKGALLPLLGHASRELRHTAGTIASVIVGQGSLEEWPELAAALPRCLQAEDPNVLDGAQDTLYKILEDHPRQIETPVASAGGRPASSLVVPPLLRLMQSAAEDVRRLAVACLNLMAPHMPSGLQENVDSYLQGLFALANDGSNRVRQEVVGGLVVAVSTCSERLAPFLPQLVEYMIGANEHSDGAVALAAAEFWTAYLELQLDPELLRPVLQRLIPVLLKNMVFGEYDDEVSEAEAAEGAATQAEDRDQDLKPFTQHRAREHGSAADSGEGSEGAGEEGSGDDDEEVFSAWNLRKCSAEALDVLSNSYGDDLLPVLLPIVQQRLQDGNWRARESAILALGAVSHGCHNGLQPFMEGMVHMLLPALRDPRPMVRIITCWTLGRYCHWLFEDVVARGPVGRPLLDQVVGGVLGAMGDNNKFVQAAAVSALAVIVESAEAHNNPEQLLEPYTKAILESLAAALSRYTRRGVAVTYDALTCTARVLGPRIADPALATIILAPLTRKFTTAKISDKDLLAAMECLANVTPHTGRAVELYAKALYDRAILLTAVYMQAGLRSRASGGAGAAAAAAAAAAGAPGSLAAIMGAWPGMNGSSEVEYDPTFIVLALDVISGLVQGLGASIESLVAASPLVPLLMQCCQDESPDVLQSAFALIGDLAAACVAHLLPVLEALVGCSLALLELPRITDASLSAANNACWSLGEVVIKVDAERVAPHAEAIAHRMTSILSYPGRMPPSLMENCSITLGRVGWRCAEQLAQYLAHFVGPWCGQLRNIRDGTEKEHAFLGLCRLVRLNPEAALPAFPMMCMAFASWRRVGCEGLRNEMAGILQLFHANLSASGRWQQVYSGVSEPVRGKLGQMFGLGF